MKILSCAILISAISAIDIRSFEQIGSTNCCCECDCPEPQCATHIFNEAEVKMKAEKKVAKMAEKILDKQEKIDQKRKLEDRIEKKIKLDQKRYDDKDHEKLIDKVNKTKNKILDK